MAAARKGVSKNCAADRTEVLGIRISHPERPLYADQGIAKIDLARYYAAVAPRMLPFAAKRPLSLVRCPQGAQKTCFFQKHASEGFPPQIRQVPIKEKSGKTADYLYVTDAAGLVAAVQMGTLEFHVWGSQIDRLESPERLVFDLDPDEGLSFGQVKSAALAMRERLAELGLKTVAMVTGGKGVHVIAPLERRAQWPSVKDFAKAIASEMAEREPERYTATMSKEKRRGRIFIDWLRNERGATAVVPYSTRSRKGAPVATPVGWDELARLEQANCFHMGEIFDRLEKDDPWQDATGWRQSITQKMLDTVAS
jgi:bifunctional non-homologous end joining protein LigD